MFWFRDASGRARVAFTDRHGGLSAAPFDTLNLAAIGGDREVEANLALVAKELGAEAGRVARMRQVHGADVGVVREVPPVGRYPTMDAMVTDEPGLVLAVRVADCVPVLLADSAARVVGCAHAGRRGLVAGVVPAAVAAMRRLGATDIRSWIGPHICGSCYEVPADLQQEVTAVVPQTQAITAWGTPALDIGAGVQAQLGAAGCTVVDAACCTRESPDLFSFRRDGTNAGRTAGLVQLLPDGTP